MTRTEQILERMYEKLDVLRDSEFCKNYNIKPSTVSSWKNRDSIPYDLILDFHKMQTFLLIMY